MTSRIFAKFAIVGAVLIAPVAQAHAYSIHVVDGVYTIECANGVTSTGSTLQVSHDQAAHFCKVRGSSITTGDNPKPPKVNLQGVLQTK